MVGMLTVRQADPLLHSQWVPTDYLACLEGWSSEHKSARGWRDIDCVFMLSISHSQKHDTVCLTKVTLKECYEGSGRNDPKWRRDGGKHSQLIQMLKLDIWEHRPSLRNAFTVPWWAKEHERLLSTGTFVGFFVVFFTPFLYLILMEFCLSDF